MIADLSLARAELDGAGRAIVFVREGVILASGARPGVADLLEIAATHGDSLRGAAVADRVVGRAAALVMRWLGVSAVYAARISEGGLAVLETGGIPVEYGECVPAVLNRTQDGPCPFEQAVAGIDDPAEAVAALQARLAVLRAG